MLVDGKEKSVLVHRKGATRAFAPHHPEIPAAYQEIGQVCELYFEPVVKAHRFVTFMCSLF